jgi:hypothetical protein
MDHFEPNSFSFTILIYPLPTIKNTIAFFLVHILVFHSIEKMLFNDIIVMSQQQ